MPCSLLIPPAIDHKGSISSIVAMFLSPIFLFVFTHRVLFLCVSGNGTLPCVLDIVLETSLVRII